MAQMNFNAAEVAPQTSFDPIPAGWYKAMITESEFKPTSRGDGEYLQLTLQVLDGQYANRKIWDRLNLRNPSKTAEEIAQASLSAICRAVGVMAVTDSVQLHNKPLMVKVKIRPANDKYEASNEPTGYKAIDGAAPAPAPAQAAQATQAAPAPQAAAATDAPPWVK